MSDEEWKLGKEDPLQLIQDRKCPAYILQSIPVIGWNIYISVCSRLNSLNYNFILQRYLRAFIKCVFFHTQPVYISMSEMDHPLRS